MQLTTPLNTLVSSIPLPLISLPVRLAFSRILKMHPKLFDRLGEHSNKVYAFILTDIPLVFVIKPEQKIIETHHQKANVQADAEIEGPLPLLLSLAEGRLDADALFFSRDVIVTGDMEAMLALRNALDDNTIDLPQDLSTLCGPLAPLAKKAAIHLRNYLLKEEK